MAKLLVSVLSVGARWIEVYEGPYTGGSVMGTVLQETHSPHTLESGAAGSRTAIYSFAKWA